MEKKIFCFGYSRKSPDEKEDTLISIKNQNDLHKLTCKKNGWNLVSIEEDLNISGNREDRKINLQIERAEILKEKRPDFEVYILVKDSKRFGRNLSFFKQTWERLSSKNIKIFSISKNGFLDYSDIGDRIIGVVDEQLIFDGLKYAQMSESLKKSKGLPCIPAPFGYMYNWTKNSKGNKKPIQKSRGMDEWVINKKEAKIILSVLNDYVKGVDYKQTTKSNKITKSKYYRIIKYAQKGIYSGWIFYNKKSGEVVKYEGKQEKLISDELYDQVRGKAEKTKKNFFETPNPQ